MNEAPAQKALPTLHVGHSYPYGALTWFPVWTDAPAKPRTYRTDPTGLEVNELDDAHVPTLRVENPSDQPIVVFEGSVFEGGFQNRTLTRTAMVPARARTEIPVMCVEAHRWGGETLRHRVGGRVSPSRVRAASRGVSLSPNGRVTRGSSDQRRVWQEVRRYQTRHNLTSPTESMVELDDRLAQGDRDLPAVQALPGQRGVIVAALGQPVALELFDHEETLRERLTDILRGFRLDVFGSPEVPTPSRRARRFAERVVKAGIHLHERVHNLGVYRSPDNDYVAADAVAVADDLLHLSALNPRHELVLAA